MTLSVDAAAATFVVLPLVLACSLAWGTWVAYRRAGASTADAWGHAFLVAAVTSMWMTVTWRLASGGVLTRWNTAPPPLILIVLVAAMGAIGLAAGPLGQRLASVPLWTLVAIQGFRLPLEIAMHAMAERGVMPPQMSYAERNFDIVSGATALIVAASLLTGLGGRRLVAAWNVLGLALLANIVGIAIVSTPTFGWFGPDRLNTWITGVPYVWLPTVMVPAALAGHLVILRALYSDRRHH